MSQRMLKVDCDLVGQYRIGFSAPIRSVKEAKESHDAFEERTWRERMHVNGDGFAVIPAMALKNCLVEAAGRLGMTVAGKGKRTYKKYFESGIMVLESMLVKPETKREDVERDHVYVPSDGRRGGGTRVWRNFPIIHPWSVHATIHAIDDALIDKPGPGVIKQHLDYAGCFTGFLYWRPANNGLYGRFNVDNYETEVIAM